MLKVARVRVQPGLCIIHLKSTDQALQQAQYHGWESVEKCGIEKETT